MKKTYYLLILMVASITITSCSIEKRLHNKGFHVELNKRYKGNSEIENEKNETAKIRIEEDLNSSSNLLSDNGNSTLSITDNISLDESVVSTSETYSIEAETQSSERIEKSNEMIANKGKSEVSKNKAKSEIKAKKVTPQNAPADGKSQVTALILVILLGVLGIHRFYLGHVGIGILMLLTAGCCGVLALIDLIRIITGDLKPKDGEYAKKLGDK